MKRKAMNDNRGSRRNYNSRNWNYSADDSNNDSSSSSQQSLEPKIKPPSSLKDAIRQFQQVLWTPSLSKAKLILQTYPQVLSHQNKIGCLPIHSAIKCTQSAYRTQIIQLIIEEGIKHNVGSAGLRVATKAGTRNNDHDRSIDGRGGLLIRSKDDKRRTGLCLLVVGDDKTDILQYLSTRKPTPLLLPKDIIQYQLLHRAAGDPFLFEDRVKTIQFLITFCPEALLATNSYGDLPIHHLCRQPGYSIKILELLVKEGIKHGIYLEPNGNGVPFLKCCMEEHVIPIMKLMQNENVPLLHNVFGFVKRSNLRFIISEIGLFKSWCHLKDSKGRLPLHYAAEIGMKYEHELKDVIDANIFAASEIDPVTGLYPFLLAACSDKKKKQEELSQEDDTDANNIHLRPIRRPMIWHQRRESYAIGSSGSEDISDGEDRQSVDDADETPVLSVVEGPQMNETNQNEEGEVSNPGFRSSGNQENYEYCDLTSIYALARCNPTCIGFQS